MRVLISLLLLCTAATASADMRCRKNVSSERTEYTDIRSWPEMITYRSYEECKVSGPITFCRSGRLTPQMTEVAVCGYRIEQRFDCQTREGWDRFGSFIETRCPRYGIQAFATIDNAGRGRLTCFRNGRVEREWNLGRCR